MLRSKILLPILFVCIALSLGCESDSTSGSSGSSSSSGGSSFSGTWNGTAAGRPMVMVISQNGASLSGSYTLSNPAFGEGFTGSASSATAPASATLIAGGGRTFQINFSSANSLAGSFLKDGVSVGAVTASK